MPDQKPLISIVICTYNRPDLLKLALKSLVNQTADVTDFEILVIENGYSPQTRRVTDYFRKKYSGRNIFYFREKHTGLSYARNLGIIKSRGKYIGFIDDDAQMLKNWLKNAIRLFKTVKPLPLAVGGPEKPIFAGKKPGWFKDEYFSPTKEKLGLHSRFLKFGESLNGSNMIIDKKVLKELGGFDEKIGMKGEYISAHEETRFFERLWQKRQGKNVNIYYSPDLLFKHLILDFKLNVGYILKRSFAAGQSWFARYGEIPFFSRLILIFLSLGYLCLHFLLFLISVFHYRNLNRWLVEKLNKVVFALGFLLLALGFTLKQKQN